MSNVKKLHSIIYLRPDQADVYGDLIKAELAKGQIVYVAGCWFAYKESESRPEFSLTQPALQGLFAD